MYILYVPNVTILEIYRECFRDISIEMKVDNGGSSPLL